MADGSFIDYKTTVIKPKEIEVLPKVTSSKGALLLSLAAQKEGLVALGVKQEVFEQVLTYAAHMDPSVAVRTMPWVMELKDLVGKAMQLYGSQTPSYWANAKLLGLKLPHLTELRKRVKAALEAWANRPVVMRPA